MWGIFRGSQPLFESALPGINSIFFYQSSFLCLSMNLSPLPSGLFASYSPPPFSVLLHRYRWRIYGTESEPILTRPLLVSEQNSVAFPACVHLYFPSLIAFSNRVTVSREDRRAPHASRPSCVTHDLWHAATFINLWPEQQGVVVAVWLP